MWPIWAYHYINPIAAAHGPIDMFLHFANASVRLGRLQFTVTRIYCDCLDLRVWNNIVMCPLCRSRLPMGLSIRSCTLRTHNQKSHNLVVNCFWELVVAHNFSIYSDLRVGSLSWMLLKYMIPSYQIKQPSLIWPTYRNPAHLNAFLVSPEQTRSRCGQ